MISEAYSKLIDSVIYKDWKLASAEFESKIDFYNNSDRALSKDLSNKLIQNKNISIWLKQKLRIYFIFIKNFKLIFRPRIGRVIYNYQLQVY